MTLTDALAAALDHHWLESSVAQSFARCSCGEWRIDIPDGLTVPQLGEHFAPFSGHVAAAILADPAFREALTADARRVGRRRRHPRRPAAGGEGGGMSGPMTEAGKWLLTFLRSRTNYGRFLNTADGADIEAIEIEAYSAGLADGGRGQDTLLSAERARIRAAVEGAVYMRCNDGWCRCADDAIATVLRIIAATTTADTAPTPEHDAPQG